MSEFQEIDEKLYNHERAYYRWCATGCGDNPMHDPVYRLKREQLTTMWKLLYPQTKAMP